MAVVDKKPKAYEQRWRTSVLCPHRDGLLIIEVNDEPPLPIGWDGQTAISSLPRDVEVVGSTCGHHQRVVHYGS